MVKISSNLVTICLHNGFASDRYWRHQPSKQRFVRINISPNPRDFFFISARVSHFFWLTRCFTMPQTFSIGHTSENLGHCWSLCWLECEDFYHFLLSQSSTTSILQSQLAFVCDFQSTFVSYTCDMVWHQLSSKPYRQSYGFLQFAEQQLELHDSPWWS